MIKQKRKLNTKLVATAKQNLTETTGFIPTPGMVKWLDSAVEIGFESVTAVSAHCKMARASWYEWLKDPDFIEWFRKEWNRRLGAQQALLDTIGLRKSKGDYRFWEGMQRRISAPGFASNPVAGRGVQFEDVKKISYIEFEKDEF